MFKVDWEKIPEPIAAAEWVLAAWVFGSAQSGSIKPGSDLDIGVFFESKPSPDELSDLRANLQDALRFDDIDLVVLNEASPITRFEAITGKAVFCRDLVKRGVFVSLTAREYEYAMAFFAVGTGQLRSSGGKIRKNSVKLWG